MKSTTIPTTGCRLSLEAFIRAHGLTHFKIKLGGDIERDRERLYRLAEVIEKQTSEYSFTARRQRKLPAPSRPFRALWEGFRADPAIARFPPAPHLRRAALPSRGGARGIDDCGTARVDGAVRRSSSMNRMPPARPCPRALAEGYAGTSHKNCKGVFHASRARASSPNAVAWIRRHALHISGEDLTNLGPVALLQDLAVVATLGIKHAERNGHRLLRRAEPVSKKMCRGRSCVIMEICMGRTRMVTPVVAVKGGALDIGSLVDAPFRHRLSNPISANSRRSRTGSTNPSNPFP
ncbi:MAG: hypothetical protein WDN28_00140 [Chthoniobacter sp.]